MLELETCESKFSWTRLTRYKGSDRDLPVVKATLNDKWSREFRSMFLSSMSERKSTNDVAQKFSDYMIKAIHRVCPIRSMYNRGRSRTPYWCDPLSDPMLLLPVLVYRVFPRGKTSCALQGISRLCAEKERNFRHKMFNM